MFAETAAVASVPPRGQVHAGQSSAAHKRIQLIVRLSEHVCLHVTHLDIVAHNTAEPHSPNLVQLASGEAARPVHAVLIIKPVAVLQVSELFCNYTFLKKLILINLII
jgi:hypothetical protein